MKNIKFKAYNKKEKKFVELSHHKQAVLLTDDGFEMSTGWDSLDNPTFGNLDDLGYTKMSDDKFKEYQDRFIYLQFTGFKLKGRELYTKDVIQFSYKDKFETGGYGYCTGVIEFENGAFVVKEIGFKHYDWKNEHQRPTLLYDWLKNNRCKYVGNVLENRNLLKSK